MKIKNILLACLGVSMAFSAMAVDLKDARIYINPGHGGWGSNDRPMATINYAVKDTLGFFETNTNLLKSLELYHNLKDAGAGYLKLSRNSNGWVLDGDAQTTPNDKITDESVQIVKLSTICADVEANNIDYFLSIHSNAATEGNTTNYPLLLYRGTDAEIGNGLVDAIKMSKDAWKYINKNDITFKSFYQNPGDMNVRGDISFMGGSATSPEGYVGYYGVLRHGADGFLSEGCFHTYQPERHRLLNPDYCRQEGERYARAIRAWFNDKGKATGDVMGTIKDKSKALEHALYKYKANSIDAYYPLNEVTVILKDAAGIKVEEYKTDKEYNGVFVFKNLKPGKYTLDYTGIEGYWPFSEEIEVKANETSFTNATITPTSIEEPAEEEETPEVTYYIHPKQDGDVAVASTYTMAKSGDVVISAITGLNVRRSILRDGKLYILALDAAKAPKLFVVNPADGALIKEISTEGIVTEGYNGKTYPYVLSDIAFTNDGVLIGANSTVIGKENNAFQTGDFYMYAWKPEGANPAEDAAPVIVYQLPTNTTASLVAAGNNNSNFMANSIAVNGNFNNFSFYFDSHAGNGWNTTYGMRYCTWTLKDGVPTSFQWNDSGSRYTETQFGEDARIALSPLSINRVVVDGSKIMTKDIEIDMLGTRTIDHADLKAEKATKESYGSNYIRYAKHILMVAPICTPNAGKFDYSINLYDVTSGLDKAQLLNESEVLTTQDAILPMWANGVVDNADITQYLMVGDKLFTNTTKGQTQAENGARIFAYDLKQENVGDSYNVTFTLNETPTSAAIVLTNTETGAEVLRKTVDAPVKGVNSIMVNKTDVESEVSITCNWGIEATAKNVSRFTKISNDDDQFKFFCPYGVSVDKSPESNYFGRVYVTNTLAGAASGRTTNVGVYVLGSDFSDITTQGNLAYSGGVSWTAKQGDGPRKLTIASDGRIFLCDQSVSNSGIYYMNPETFAAAPIFTGATRDAAGKLTIGGTYVCGTIHSLGIRGEGEKTELYAVDGVASGSAWKKHVNVYNIGESTTFTSAPAYSKAASSYIGNGNNSIQPISTGFWAGQYRGGGSNSSANPCLFYYSDSHADAVWDSATPNIIPESSQNGAMAVKEDEKLIALSVNGGVAVYSYKMNKEKIPTVVEKFRATLPGQGANSNDFEFDYAGNLYAVSNSGERLGVWAIPTANNTCITPAKKSMTISIGSSSVEENVTASKAVSVYPNPATDVINISAGELINVVNIYSISSGSLVETVGGNGTNETSIDVSGLSAGVYLVKINAAAPVKIIKK